MPTPRDFVIRIALLNASLRNDDDSTELSPSVWRRFRCSSHLPLDVVHDKVIAPVMGWCRNYHGYLFSSDDEGYMVEECSSSEMMHVRDYGHYNATGSVEDTTLGQLFSKVGDKAYYIYDLGDFWKHVMVLEQVLKKGEAHGQCLVLDGAMRCPAEDTHGGVSYQLDILDDYNKLREDPHNKDLAREHADACFSGGRNALNVKGSFCPTDFSLQKRQEAIQKAFQSRASVLTGVKLFLSGPDIDVVRPGPGQRILRTIFEDDRFPPHGVATAQELVNIKPDDDREAACVCGDPLLLKLCARCQSISYCCRYCQKKDWPNHKSKCKQEKANHEQNEKEQEDWETNRPSRKDLTLVGTMVQVQKWTIPLRFKVGTLVECQIGEDMWGEGTIVQSPYCHQDGALHPYQIRIDPTSCPPGAIPAGMAPLIFAMWDDDLQVRKVPSC
jgi:hypothetical protein